MEQEQGELGIRSATVEDMRFVHSSWHTSFWHYFAKGAIPREIYAPYQDKLIDRLIGRSLVYIAFSTAVPDEVFGYSVKQVGTPILHYVYVKHPYRRLGIARGLVHGTTHVTHRCKGDGVKFADAIGLQYNPYLIHM